ncbi:MAG: hypothetical protein J7J61_05560 [Candidatus Hydrothermae bacterium]|nr:hypothetical protein [Candidatus Hydrothermae bacterium]
MTVKLIIISDILDSIGYISLITQYLKVNIAIKARQFFRNAIIDEMISINNSMSVTRIINSFEN